MHRTGLTIKLLVTILLTTLLVPAAHAEVRWNSKFRESYQSAAEGKRVSFSVRTPPEVEGMEGYPLLIALSGGLRISPNEEFPFFQANPTRTRIWGYRSMSTYDAMQVLVTMKRKYPIDPNRVYVMGFSAGGSGAMHLTSCFPDQFAAVIPMVAAGNNYPLANFRNLPVAFHHGDRDWTSAVCNARVQARRMQALGFPTIYKEYKGAGHSIPGSHVPLMKWLFEQKRNAVPQLLTHDCEAPSLGRSYWFTIREFDDPHQRAYVAAEIKGTNVVVRPKNINAFSLDLKALSDIETVQIGKKQLLLGANYVNQNGRWIIVDALPAKPQRPYEAGAATNLYQGEPLVIVYGTAGDRTTQLKAAAAKLAKYGGPDYTTMPGAFPVVADSNLTPEQESKSNLILIGTPDENSVTQSVLPQLPLSIENGALVSGARPKLSLKGQVLSVVHPNPKHPKRLVCLLAPYTDNAGLARVIASPMRFLSGPDGFDRVSQADLLLQNTKYQIARQMQFDKNWNWIDFTGADKPIPARYAIRSSLAVNYMEIMRTKSKADFSLWWGPADKGMWGADFNDLESYNPGFYTQADYATQRRLYETTLGSVAGADLKIIWKRWGLNQELQSIPEIALDSIEDKRMYRLHIPMDLYIKLGQRRKNLVNPDAGPTIDAREVLKAVFRSS